MRRPTIHVYNIILILIYTYIYSYITIISYITTLFFPSLTSYYIMCIRAARIRARIIYRLRRSLRKNISRRMTMTTTTTTTIISIRAVCDQDRFLIGSTVTGTCSASEKPRSRLRRPQNVRCLNYR